MKPPMGFIPSWPRLLNKENPESDGDMEVIPCGVVLGIESYWQVDDDSVINEARRYLRDEAGK